MVTKPESKSDKPREADESVFNEETKVVGQSAKALEQFAMKRTCGSHLPPLDQKIREENSRRIKPANRQ